MSDHHLAKGLSLSSVHDFGIHYLPIPKFEFFTNFPFQAQNTPLQNCIPSLGSFPSPWTVYSDFDSCYSHFMPYRMTPSVRHRAIEVHYYYYYYYYLISHLALRQSQSKIPSLHSLLFPVVYPKVPYLAHSFLLSIQLLSAR